MFGFSKTQVLFFCAAVLASTAARAQNVPTYPGCDNPNSGYSRTLYIDPISGRDSGSGTEASPYRTLQNVVANSRLRVGDRVVLLAGHHGSVDMNQRNSKPLETATQWVWLDGRPGATLTTLNITGLRRIAVTGVTIQGGRPYLVHLDRVRDFVLARSHLRGRSRPDYSIQGWIKDAPHGVNTSAGILCSSIVDNLVENIRVGIGTLSDDTQNSPETNSIRSLIQNNRIHNFSADGIRFSGSEVIVRANTILDAYLDQFESIDTNHDDAIQFWGADPRLSATYRNALIEDNWIQSTTNRNRSTNSSHMHGIGHYNANYRRVTIRRNVVLATSYEGISVGARDSVIENNTLANHIDDKKIAINIHPTNEGFMPSRTVVRNNISELFTVGYGASQVNNMIYGNRPYADFFMRFSSSTNDFDLRPLPSGPLAGEGIGAF